tara:strand:+ start:289 stop:513 length:225 start_codon:yes stop_codon:yes gene_type:complete
MTKTNRQFPTILRESNIPALVENSLPKNNSTKTTSKKCIITRKTSNVVNVFLDLINIKARATNIKRLDIFWKLL